MAAHPFLRSFSNLLRQFMAKIYIALAAISSSSRSGLPRFAAFPHHFFGNDMKKSHVFLMFTVAAALMPAASFAYEGQINLNGTIQPNTCAITTPNVSTTVGSYRTWDFTGLGSTSPWGQDFQIQLDCAGVTSKVTIGLTDATNPGNVSDVLSLTPASTAKGLGIEVWQQNGAIYKYGPDTTTPGGANQVLVLNGTGNTPQLVTLKFSTRYRQTGANVTMGSANGAATYTLQYQ